MEVRHVDSDLEDAERNPEYRGALDRKRLRDFRKVMNVLRQVSNETELLRFRSLNYERLKGKRKHEHSVRTNKQWRLIFEIEKRGGPNNNVLVIKGIEDYH
ncbi:Plasmid maintenance system killer protein [Posidoniimonas corsicana]|uniref:Plasmid maintenance system killer protein n=2 Tax=Posidoniimonas corsicana TaxID=1938618 RepID=A0A5C5VG20_9BACT|nr:Plasmid maintenance system killer protein [Posidoniimonas corsicana]